MPESGTGFSLIQYPLIRLKPKPLCLEPLRDNRRVFVEDHTAAFHDLFLHGLHIHGTNGGATALRFHRGDAAGLTERHEDRFHAQGLIADMARAARDGNEQSIHTLRHQDAIRELERIVGDEEVTWAQQRIGGIVFSHGVGVELKLGDGDAIGERWLSWVVTAGEWLRL